MPPAVNFLPGIGFYIWVIGRPMIAHSRRCDPFHRQNRRDCGQASRDCDSMELCGVKKLMQLFFRVYSFYAFFSGYDAR